MSPDPQPFTSEELELIQTHEVSLLSPAERARRFLLYIRPIHEPFEPGKPAIVNALILNVRGRGGTKGAVDEIVSALEKAEDGRLDFRRYGGWWQATVEGVRVIIDHFRQTELALPSRLARQQRLSFADYLSRDFGGYPTEWQGIGPSDYDLIAAKLVQLRVPQLFDEIPASVRNRLPQFGGPTVVIQPPAPSAVSPLRR